jgi:iron complex transport system substrate-binding protein
VGGTFSSPAPVTELNTSAEEQFASVAKDGREIFLGQLEAGAFSFSSPLSIPYFLDQLVPQIEAAFDGDPATSVPESP